MTRPLVVNADDLGLSRGINAAIRRAHVDGIVTSTSLLTVGRYAADAAAMLRATPSLAAGVHLALVGEDPPLLSAREVPTLVDRAGRFPLSYRTFVARAATGRVDLDDVRRELGAQVQAGLDLGLELGHLDTHQHVHLWPGVGAVVV
ncbi:MAG TPA: ChbG/HpnK family deacetylase, partial [Phycicoccus elongatus]|nr:ChbG/HpnK family deacetylase [Phycicoccus elongatus]